MDTVYEDDGSHVVMTTISVHSPVIQNSKNGAFYTSYAISLKTNNSCFTLRQSCVRRRYSEFVHLRGILKTQHPAIDPPLLPPKSYFNRFNNSFVAQRAEGLEIFLKKILDIPVYLSNKGVHLFLQTQFTMSKIDELVTGDIPAPQLVGVNIHNTSLFEESCSSLPSTGSTESSSASCGVNVCLFVPSLTQKQCEECDYGCAPYEQPCSVPESKPINIAATSDLGGIQTVSLSTCNSALSDTSEKSLSSTSSSPDSERGGVRRVSFNEKVTVAVVQNKLWNYAVKPIKAGAC